MMCRATVRGLPPPGEMIQESYPLPFGSGGVRAGGIFLRPRAQGEKKWPNRK